MDDRTTESSSAGSLTLDIGQKVREQRGRVQEFVATQRSRLDRVETQLADQLERIQQELDREREQSGEVLGQVSQRSVELEARQAQLDQLQWELNEREQRFAEMRRRTLVEHDERSARLTEQAESLAREKSAQNEADAELDRKAANIAILESQVSDCSTQIAVRQSALVESESRVAALELELTEKEAVLRRRETDLENHSADLVEQQALLNTEFEQMNAARNLEQSAARRCEELDLQLESLQAQLRESQICVEALTLAQEQAQNERAALVADHLAANQAACTEFNEQLALQSVALSVAVSARDAASEQLNSTCRELEELRAKLAAQEAQYVEAQRRILSTSEELEGARRELATSAEQLELRDVALAEHRAALTEALARLRDIQLEKQTSDQAASRATSSEIERLTKERQMLLLRLAEAEARAEARVEAPADDPRVADFEQRYQMALDDLREQKERIAELQQQLGQAGSSGSRSSREVASASGMDWESQKRRLLASLESSSDSDDPEQAEDRLQLKEAIRTTQQVVVEKDRELARLRRQLHEAGEVQADAAASDAASISATLDKDLSIQQERLKLEKLQVEWQEKLRHAEVDISVERAKIARDRAQLEEKLAQLRQEQASMQQPEGQGSDSSVKPTRGRWLARLGLNKDASDD